MSDDQAVLPFECDGRVIRRQWVNDRWYFSVVDVVAVLTDSPNPRNYWSMLKRKLADEGYDELYTTRSEQNQKRTKMLQYRYRAREMHPLQSGAPL